MNWDEIKREDMKADIDEYEVCSCCGYKITPCQEHYYNINDEIFCESCILDFRK